MELSGLEPLPPAPLGLLIGTLHPSRRQTFSWLCQRPALPFFQSELNGSPGYPGPLRQFHVPVNASFEGQHCLHLLGGVIGRLTQARFRVSKYCAQRAPLGARDLIR